MKNLLFLVFLLLILTLSGSVSFSQEKEEVKKLVHRADLIIQAEVVETKSRTSTWWGYVPSYQEMVYKVENVIKGALKEKEIIVDHAVVFNSRTADKSIPQLSEQLFQPGRKFILFLQVKKNELVVRGLEGEVLEDPTDRPFRYKVLSENFGALNYSRDRERLVRKYLRRRNAN